MLRLVRAFLRASGDGDADGVANWLHVSCRGAQLRLLTS